MGLKETLDEPVSNYMSGNFAKVSVDDSVATAAMTMKKAGATEAIVVKDGMPIGIVTERDILYKVVATGSDPSVVDVEHVMSSPVHSIEQTSKVGDAVAKMSKLGIRRLGVTSGGRLVGMVTQKAMVSGRLSQDVALPELASPARIACPYCDATMKDRDELSRHIDQVHLGLGLLEGNLTKW
ncbi:MAG: CBS domain-containing protein [Thaumarchaeota archaeon]|nr:CBS domain-containing protein [Nitrososphaerota archaeon]